MTKPTSIPYSSTNSQAPDVAGQIAGLLELEPEKLRSAWRRTYRVPPPKGLSRDMLIRAIAYKIQERAFGGLSKSTLRQLATLARAFDGPEGKSRAPHASLKPGTKLLREWGGTTHTVLVLDDGFEYLGQRYASLTKVAEVISGLHRSGPAFFGLKRAAARFGGRCRASSGEGTTNG